jgi:hypothetical protein
MAIIVLGLAMFAFWSRNAWPMYWPGDRDRDPFGFGHAKMSLSRSFDQQQPKGWLHRASDESNDGRGHVPAYPQDGDVNIEQ